MSRWHSADCQKPDVRVEDNVPRCWACGAAPHLGSILAAASQLSSLPHIPPDEPLDQMNLWWPPSVPYTREDTSEAQIGPQEPLEHRGLAVGHFAHVFARGEADGTTAPVNLEEHIPDTRGSRCGHHPKPVPAIYTTPLTPDHFRLLCLHAPPSVQQDFPVHCDLETFPLDDCPEYEAISYAWGGENGDSTKRCPIYIGPYWDVLVQTQNCSDMLRHVRPRRGFRFVWVDAICINQEDEGERERQILSMARIYGMCLRVVAYLGQDLCSPLPAGRSYRRRAGLETLPDLGEFLGRRYFSRVWVIQELVLSKLVVLRVGSTDYEIHASTFADYKKPELTPAHWVRYAAKGMLTGDDIADTIRFTWESGASDPRDRVYGILGLLEYPMSGPLPSPRLDLTANYGLSPQHVFTGFFAYLIVRMGSSKILAAAVGIEGWGQMPSWMPDWQADLHSRPRSFGQNAGKLAGDGRFSKLGRLSDIPMLSCHSRQENSKPKIASKVFSMRLRELVAVQEKETHMASNSRELPRLIPWNHEIRVDARTARLQIALVHIMPVPSSPNLIATEEGLCTYWLPVSTGDDYGVVIMTNGELNCRLQPRLDHFFVLDHGDGVCTHLILRPSSSKIATLPTLNNYGNDRYQGAGDRHRCLSWGDWRVVALCSRLFLSYSPDADFQYQGRDTPGLLLSCIHLNQLRFPRSMRVGGFVGQMHYGVRSYKHPLNFLDLSSRFIAILLGPKGYTPASVACLMQAIIEQDVDDKEPGKFAREFVRLADPRMEPHATASHLSWAVWYWKEVSVEHLKLWNTAAEGGVGISMQTPEQKTKVFATNFLGENPSCSTLGGFDSRGPNAPPIVRIPVDKAISLIKGDWRYRLVKALSALTAGDPVRAITSGTTLLEELTGFPDGQSSNGMRLDEAIAFQFDGSTYSIGLV
ncbi:hypothetical protein RB595_002245 [Gaeumannomyces hyphopodioides]